MKKPTDVCQICATPEYFYYLQREFESHEYVPGGKIKRCITYGCTNSSDQGGFVGQLCWPCYEFVITGRGKYSKVFLNAVQLYKEEVELEARKRKETKAANECEESVKSNGSKDQSCIRNYR